MVSHISLHSAMVNVDVFSHNINQIVHNDNKLQNKEMYTDNNNFPYIFIITMIHTFLLYIYI